MPQLLPALLVIHHKSPYSLVTWLPVHELLCGTGAAKCYESMRSLTLHGALLGSPRYVAPAPPPPVTALCTLLPRRQGRSQRRRITGRGHPSLPHLWLECRRELPVVPVPVEQFPSRTGRTSAQGWYWTRFRRCISFVPFAAPTVSATLCFQRSVAVMTARTRSSWPLVAVALGNCMPVCCLCCSGSCRRQRPSSATLHTERWNTSWLLVTVVLHRHGRCFSRIVYETMRQARRQLHYHGRRRGPWPQQGLPQCVCSSLLSRVFTVVTLWTPNF